MKVCLLLSSFEIADAEEALDAAQDAFADWASRTPELGPKYCIEAYELMIEEPEKFAHFNNFRKR